MKSAIALRCTSDLFFAAGNLIINIEKYSPFFNTDYLIFTDDASDKNFESLKILCTYYKKNITFVEYTYENYALRSNITREELSENHNLKRYPILVFSVFEIFDYLNEYQDILLLDLDMYLSGSIYDIKKLGPLAFAESRILNTNLKNIEFSDKAKTPNVGCLYVTDKIEDYRRLSSECYKILNKFHSNIVVNTEETVLSILFELFHIKHNKLSSSFNNYITSKDSNQANLIHLLRFDKYWKNPNILRYCSEILNSINKFNKITKDKYNNVKIDDFSIYSVLQENFYSFYWNVLYKNSVDILKNSYILNDNKQRYFQVFLHNLPRTIHYEFSIEDKKNWGMFCKDNFKIINKIQLHFEDKKNVINLTKNEVSVKSLFKNFNIDFSESCVNVYIVSDIENYFESLQKFFTSTYPFLNLIKNNDYKMFQ